MPRPKKAIDTSDQEIGVDEVRHFSSGPQPQMQRAPLQVVDRPLDPEKVAMLAFMEELVTIRMATTNDPNAEQVFEIWVNGNGHVFKRGETYTLKRYFVDNLARRKVTTFGNEKTRNKDGEESYVWPSHTALKYDFQMVRDDHPRGADWLTHVLREP